MDEISSGNTFAYIDENVDTKGYALANTIDNLNAAGSSLSMIFYNDEPPDAEVVFTGAHAKGFIVYDKSA